MIKKDEVFKIGIFNKPHGVKGELSFTFTDDIFDRVDCEYLICLLDGIFVPFFIEEYRFRSDTTALVKLKVPLRLTAITASQSCSVMRSMRVSRVIPALLTRISSLPKSAQVEAGESR